MTETTFNIQTAFEGVHERLSSIASGQVNAATHLAELDVHLAKVDVHLGDLLGNGQPGRIAKLEITAQSYKQDRAWMKGTIWAVGAMIVLLGALEHYGLYLLMLRAGK